MNVEDYQPWCRAAQQFKRIIRVRCGSNAVAFAGQGFDYRVDALTIVVNHGYLIRRHGNFPRFKLPLSSPGLPNILTSQPERDQWRMPFRPAAVGPGSGGLNRNALATRIRFLR
jgi:hypothetical protein